jgi:DNA invertase Pin-like site-specific DNA recombinase
MQYLNSLKEGDIVVVPELSRLGRNLVEIMRILHDSMEKNIKIISVKEGYELGNNINSKVLAFAFGLSAEIERNLISQRTKEALARKKSEGKKLGRPRGSLSKITKLTGKEEMIRDLLSRNIPVSSIAKILEVNRLTVRNFILTRNLK